MSNLTHVSDGARPVIQLLAAPDLRGGWSLEIQVVYLTGRKITKRGLGHGRTVAGLIAGCLELLQNAAADGLPNLPMASTELWLAAELESRR